MVRTEEDRDGNCQVSYSDHCPKEQEELALHQSWAASMPNALPVISFIF
jgi:hypothetical protein